MQQKMEKEVSMITVATTTTTTKIIVEQRMQPEHHHQIRKLVVDSINKRKICLVQK